MADMLAWIRLPDLPFLQSGPKHDDEDSSRPRFPPWKLPHAGLPAALPLLSLPLLPRNALTTSSSSARPPEEGGSLCVEVSGSGLRRVYRPRGTATQGFQMEEERQTHGGRLRALAQSYLLPQVGWGLSPDHTVPSTPCPHTGAYSTLTHLLTCCLRASPTASPRSTAPTCSGGEYSTSSAVGGRGEAEPIRRW